MKKQFDALVADEETRSVSLPLLGNDKTSTLRINVPRTAKRCAIFSFADLCRANVGAAEYITLANHFHTIAIVGVPVRLLRIARRAANNSV